MAKKKEEPKAVKAENEYSLPQTIKGASSVIVSDVTQIKTRSPRTEAGR